MRDLAHRARSGKPEAEEDDRRWEPASTTSLAATRCWGGRGGAGTADVDLASWTPDQVAEWLEFEAGLPEYRGSFFRNSHPELFDAF